MSVAGKQTPVIIGVGDIRNASTKVQDAREPAELMLSAIREALGDTGLSSIDALLAQISRQCQGRYSMSQRHLAVVGHLQDQFVNRACARPLRTLNLGPSYRTRDEAFAAAALAQRAL